MCGQCWESYFAGYLTKGEVYQCVYYLDYFRNQRNTRHAQPKRDPDDPRYVLRLGEGLLPFLFRSISDEREWFDLIYRPTRRRRIYRLMASGRGASRSRRECARGVVEEPIWVAKQLDEY